MISEILDQILGSANKEVRSYYNQIRSTSQDFTLLKFVQAYVASYLLPACAEFEETALIISTTDEIRTIKALKDSLTKIAEVGEDAYFLINPILDSAWKLLLNSYGPIGKLERTVMTRVSPTFLFQEANELFQMNLRGPFGGNTHRDFTIAVFLAAMRMSVDTEWFSLP